jgi:hypothetical protein
MLTVLSRLTLLKTISRDFNCETFAVRVSWKMKNDVYTQLPKFSRSVPQDLANTRAALTLHFAHTVHLWGSYDSHCKQGLFT